MDIINFCNFACNKKSETWVKNKYIFMRISKIHVTNDIVLINYSCFSSRRHYAKFSYNICEQEGRGSIGS